jgi:hypothetical protein
LLILRNDAAKRGDLRVANRCKPAFGIKKVVLHVDDDQGGARQVDLYRFRLGGKPDRLWFDSLAHEADPGRIPRPAISPSLSVMKIAHATLLFGQSVDA